MARPDAVATHVPARLDRLPWSRFHWLVAGTLGITWLLDGLEVTLAGSVSGALTESPSLALTPAQVGMTASAYLAGAVLGSLLFGNLTDRFGRKPLFSITLGLYLAGTALTACAWDFQSFMLFRFLTGAGIGGEYSAINSAIQELIPARHRGRTDLVINGTFWLGAALGAAGAVILLEPGRFDPDTGWRLAFGIGAALGACVLFLRRHLPESPRWLMTHGQVTEAEHTVADIEAAILRRRPGATLPALGTPIRLGTMASASMGTVLSTVLRLYPRRTFLCVVLMTSQAFLYNAIFFTYALVLQTFYAIPAASVGWYIFPFAIGNFLGPLLLGPLFDTVGRRRMIAATYILSGTLLAVAAWLFFIDALDAREQTGAWCAIFFFASAAASAAYLTVGEIFPLEIRANAIALFYAGGTALGGVAGPWLFGTLIESGARADLLWAYLLSASLMIGAGLTAYFLCIDAERRPLEEVAPPLSCGG
jgi:MFS family permease